MMQTQVLTNSNRQPVAEIISDRKGKQEIKFLDFSLLDRIKQAGGVLPPFFWTQICLNYFLSIFTNSSNSKFLHSI